jgi:hypothetical protein
MIFITLITALTLGIVCVVGWFFDAISQYQDKIDRGE